MYVCMYVCMYGIDGCMYVCMYVCIYVCTYVCMALFTPLTVPTEGVLHVEYAAYLKRLGSKLATKWQCSNSVVMNSVRVRTHFAITRAVDLRLTDQDKNHQFRLQDGSVLGGHLY